MLINAFTDKELQEIVDDLYLDDTVDIIEEMPANVVARIIKSADAETRKQINQILKYPKDSAGSIMTTEYVYLHRSYTAKLILDKYKGGEKLLPIQDPADINKYLKDIAILCGINKRICFHTSRHTSCSGFPHGGCWRPFRRPY